MRKKKKDMNSDKEKVCITMLNFHHTNHHNKTPILMQFVFVMCFAQAYGQENPLKSGRFELNGTFHHMQAS